MEKLEIKNLSKRYRKTVALDNINLLISPGIYGLLGPNGAGKTTLMRILATLIQQDSGSIEMAQINWKDKKAVQEKLGYLPQHFGIYKYLTVGETLEHIAILKKVPKKMVKKEIEIVLEKTNMTLQKDKKIKQLSGGMLRRTGIAQALIGDPKLLIVDEPTAGLDPEERVRFRNLLHNFKKDSIVIISSHIVDDIQSICNNVGILYKGKILADDFVNNIVNIAKGNVFQSIVNNKEYQNIMENFTIINAQHIYDKIEVRYIDEKSSGRECVEPTLEDSYMFLIGGAHDEVQDFKPYL